MENQFKRTGLKKYDWNKIKLEYLASPINEISVFIKQHLGIEIVKSWNAAHKTTGWQREKDAMRLEAMKIAKENLLKEQVKMYEPSIEELNKMHKGTIQLIQLSLQYLNEQCINIDPITGRPVLVRMPDTNDTTRLWKMVKAEKKEPESFTWNDFKKEMELGE